MGRTLPSIKMELDELRTAVFAKYYRALREEDQRVVNDLFRFAHDHLAESAYAANALPMETFLLSMLLEVHKAGLKRDDDMDMMITQMQALRSEIDELKAKALPG
jgi:hypothetical protein